MIDLDAQYEQLESYDAIARAGVRKLRAHPVGTAGLVGMKLLRAWHGTDSQRLNQYIFWLQLLYLGAIAWASWRAWQPGAERRRLTTIVAIFAVFFRGMNVLVLLLVRYMGLAIRPAFLLVPAAPEPGLCSSPAVSSCPLMNRSA